MLKLNALTLLSLAALGLPACGGDDTNPDADSMGAEATPGGDVIGGKADGTGYSTWAVTGASVQGLQRDLSSVTPEVSALFPGDPLSIGAYLAPMSCLGHYGPIGPWGPLGVSGPVGQNAWNPSVYVSGDGDAEGASAGEGIPAKRALAWSDWAESLTEQNGPLSADGPLGPNGPLGSAYSDDTLLSGDFDRQVRGGGVFGVLGPIGPLGALGPLGPLGPLGAHGYTRDANGRFLNGRKIVRTVSIDQGDGTTRKFPLFEQYVEKFAKADTGNDTSFMVHGVVSPATETDSYKFRSAEDQIVTLLVVPESASLFTSQAMGVLWAASLIGYEYPPVAPTPRYTTDDFNLQLEDSTGKVLVASSALDAPDWIQVRVPAGASLRARVSMKTSWDSWNASPTSRKYRLFVVGSTADLAATDIGGDHQLDLTL